MPEPQHEDYIRATVAGFRSNLEGIVDSAKARTLARLGRSLTFDPQGRIEMTAQNQRTLRQVSPMFLEELDDAGYNRLARGFTSSFPGQLPAFRSALEAVGAPPIDFSREVTRALASQQLTTRQLLRGAVERAASAAQKEALVSVGGIPYEDLAAAISKRISATPAQAQTLANTAMTTYYRMMVAAADTKLNGTPRYKFSNVIDHVTRPWCRKMVAASKKRSWTRSEIEHMDNGQGLPPFLCGGGYNCRGVWVLDSI